VPAALCLPRRRRGGGGGGGGGRRRTRCCTQPYTPAVQRWRCGGSAGRARSPQPCPPPYPPLPPSLLPRVRPGATWARSAATPIALPLRPAGISSDELLRRNSPQWGNATAEGGEGGRERNGSSDRLPITWSRVGPGRRRERLGEGLSNLKADATTTGHNSWPADYTSGTYISDHLL
jgi:hypothetical protein